MADPSIPAALAPAFAVGFAVQRAFEILDSPIGMVTGLSAGAERKHLALNTIALLIGVALSFGIGLHVLQSLGVAEGQLGPLSVTPTSPTAWSRA